MPVPENKRPQPPAWAQQLLTLWAHPDTAEEVQGDLLEFYAQWVETMGEPKARLRYWCTVLTLLRPFAKTKRVDSYPSPFF